MPDNLDDRRLYGFVDVGRFVHQHISQVVEYTLYNLRAEAVLEQPYHQAEILYDQEDDGFIALLDSHQGLQVDLADALVLECGGVHQQVLLEFFLEEIGGEFLMFVDVIVGKQLLHGADGGFK